MSDALKAEATGQPVTFEFKGKSFTIPTFYDDYPLSFIEAMSAEAPLDVQLRELFGPKQWAVVREFGLTGKGLRELRDACDAAAGFEEGEEEASSN